MCVCVMEITSETGLKFFYFFNFKTEQNLFQIKITEYFKC